MPVWRTRSRRRAKSIVTPHANRPRFRRRRPISIRRGARRWPPSAPGWRGGAPRWQPASARSAVGRLARSCSTSLPGRTCCSAAVTRRLSVGLLIVGAQRQRELERALANRRPRAAAVPHRRAVHRRRRRACSHDRRARGRADLTLPPTHRGNIAPRTRGSLTAGVLFTGRTAACKTARRRVPPSPNTTIPRPSLDAGPSSDKRKRRASCLRDRIQACCFDSGRRRAPRRVRPLLPERRCRDSGDGHGAPALFGRDARMAE